MTISYLALGSNLGDRLETLQKAVKLLDQEPEIQVIKKSKLYETLPYGDVPQENYYNAVIQINTTYDPLQLLNKTQAIEKKLGRERLIHWGPRTLDIDILLMNGEKIATDRLTIPHKEMLKRSFVLVPLKDVYSEETYQGKSFDQLIATTGNQAEVWLSKESW
ncbi:2-amino-4-hydroxy-6-hydroxymethyldihydropteridine diphosphokinase [Enterococcus sp. 7E2_DIV0204]|uniref:2-amino-4-hydroxy-6-hydroxymethyldihydropteridine diphosphokinase n=1 Tax=Candidatus Enterococcus lemimoniae TaxID=1834167 RepID=A0ABZ2T9I1_9ENTE|nr:MULTISPECIES: 2-amino-4-hydroxy-6-hydroxymethyldihydropteridine diphosphokinase [unclassified Enterococcus]OTN87873.1 2-amino-4-hydroxy-6-hydroxymethyldihydropteridine diphosphokinase [Enterococcus sp. 7E2_DIV0204]OTO70044.1 2-amino-4-hydroxy-6-hydroxymethyldihydropteridine diphosphokinase [Enterococcus sp. 12C11_DIV0727]OTP49450.1 2-amino-4-hydroxy-6-hydroxymethyldihydropteridine diphosphokinase [Enterococcus sp. 7D2_DIV0200]